MSWLMTPAKSQNVFDDLIFTPLDLPNPPEIDVARFIRWMEVGQNDATAAPKVAFERLEKREYPWLVRNLHEDLSPLQAEFPDVYDYLAAFPFRRVRTLVILAQRGFQSVHTHTDSDGLCGMRFYLTRKNAEGLHFYKGRERYDHFGTYMRQNGAVVRADWDKYFRTDEPVYATLPEDKKVFMLNNARAAHAVDANTCELGDRIAVLVQGEYDPVRRDELLRRSVEKYANQAIWY